MTISTRILLLLSVFCFCGHAASGDDPTEGEATTKDESTPPVQVALVGSFEAGEQRYKQSCINCHGAAGKGAASFPKISGQEISYTKEKLETYRSGVKIGPNSSLMIMMARPLSDQEIADLAAYLKEV